MSDIPGLEFAHTWGSRQFLGLGAQLAAFAAAVAFLVWLASPSGSGPDA